MKDSAGFQNKNLASKRSERQIEWIGEIPEEWKKRRLKYLCSITNGDEDTQNADSDGEYPFYVRSPNIERCTRYTFNGEGILVAGDGAGAGRIFIMLMGNMPFINGFIFFMILNVILFFCIII